ncbi:MAG: hypothetical protein U9O98_08370 [Asgard group archaeon]|nr:hypothetical protein [Asgard group archaeon]
MALNIRILLRSLLSGIIGIILSVFTIFLLPQSPILFWVLFVLQWIIISVYIGFFMEKWYEIFFTSTIISLMVFIVLFVSSLLFVQLVQSFYQALSFEWFLSPEKTIWQYFSYALVLTMVFFLGLILSNSIVLITKKKLSSEFKQIEQIDEDRYFHKYELSQKNTNGLITKQED